MRSYLLTVLVWCAPLFAAQLTENFSSLTQWDATPSTGIWNAALQRLEPNRVIDRDLSTGGFNEDDTVSFGNGSDGAFSTATQYLFDVNKGASPGTVTLDTSRTYQFTTFTLATNITIRPQGTSPLVIRVQGNAAIAGRIDLRGSSGSAPEPAATTPSGGSALAGGGLGGAGGSGGTNATNGSGTGGGSAGSNSGGGVGGGGGGGGFVSGSGTAGVSGASAGGAVGASYGDNYATEATANGGSGGGGGGGSSSGYLSGGGGGGGGGAIVLSAGGNIRVESNGSILAYGGDGGIPDDTGGSCASGGGGSGGTIALFAGGRVLNNGTLNARGGFGGGGECTSDGGDGSVGRLRICDSSTDPTSGTTPVFQFPSPLTAGAPHGQVFYVTSTAAEIYSRSYDLRNTFPIFDSIAMDSTQPAGSTLTLEIAGSNDNFALDDTGWLSTTSISQLSGKRYLKFKVTLLAVNETDPPLVRSITLNYTPRLQGTFDVKQAGCAAIHQAEGETGGLWYFLAFLIYCLSLPGLFRLIQSSTSKASSR